MREWHGCRTDRGEGQALAGLQERADLAQRKAQRRIRTLAERRHLPQQHAKRPHVRLARHRVCGEGLRRQRAHSQPPRSAELERCLALRQHLGQPKVANLHHVPVAQQHVARRDVAVHDAVLQMVSNG